MQVDISSGPAFAFGTVEVGPGAEVKVEAGAMAAMTGDVTIETQATGGLLGGLKRSVLGGESFFINTFRSDAGGHVAVAAKLPGDLRLLSLTGNTWFVQSGSWIASDPGIDVGHEVGRGQDVLRRGGPVPAEVLGGRRRPRLELRGHPRAPGRRRPELRDRHRSRGRVPGGDAVRGREGGIVEVDVLGAEGLVVRFQGPGSVWLQTRSPQDLIGWVTQHIPHDRS